MLYVGGPNKLLRNPRRQMADVFIIEKTQYFHNRLTNFDKFGTVMHLDPSDAKTHRISAF